jgi:hypothetical protein
LPVKLGYFGLMIDGLLLALAKELGGVCEKLLFPAGDLG